MGKKSGKPWPTEFAEIPRFGISIFKTAKNHVFFFFAFYPEELGFSDFATNPEKQTDLNVKILCIGKD